MATGMVTQDKRQERAQGIIARNECTLLECGAVRVVDTQTGSGTPHYVLNGVCDCHDARRGNKCKHAQAAAAELARYAGETTRCGAWYKGEYYTAEQCDAFAAARAAEQPTCPTCGASTYADMFNVAGSYRTYRICVADKYHQATRLS